MKQQRSFSHLSFPIDLSTFWLHPSKVSAREMNFIICCHPFTESIGMYLVVIPIRKLKELVLVGFTKVSAIHSLIFAVKLLTH